VSGPKSGSYEVVSEEELRRRRLQAARDRFRRVQQTQAELAGAVRAATATYGSVPVAAPADHAPRGADPETWERAAAALEVAVTRSREELDAAVRALRVQSLAPTLDMTLTLAPDQPSPARTPARGSVADTTADAAAHGELARVLGRLPADSAPAAVERCRGLAAAIRDEKAVLRREALLGDLRFVVQHETDAAKLRRTNAQRVEALYRQLDGLVGTRVETMRGLLKGLWLDEPLPASLETDVEAAVAEAGAEQDREFVLAAAGAALRDLGYAVDEGFATAVPSDGALLDLPHSRRHGVRVRERDRQLMVNVVRLDEAGIRDPLADEQAEARFCGDFARLRAELERQGVQLAMTRAEPPGRIPVQVVRPSRRHDQRRVAQPRVRQRPS
jgi:hypothetical protein